MDERFGTQVIAVTGGKGGVGKSNVAVNLSMALAKMHKRVVLLDADLGLANVDVLLGLKPKFTMEDVLSDRCTMQEVLLEGPGGIHIIPAASGTQELADLKGLQQAAMISAFSELEDMVDVLVVDTPAGISSQVTNFVCASHEVIIVLRDEPTSLTDAYAQIKLLNQRYGKTRFRVLSNMIDDVRHGQRVFDKLQLATDRYLSVNLHYAGHIPYDDNLVQAVRKQKALLESSPRSKASLAFRHLADKAVRWPLPSAPNGQLQFFIEQLISRQAA